MPAARRTRPKRVNYRGLPLLVQWGLPLAAAAGLIVALVIWVNYETNDVPSEAGVNSPKAIVEQNQQANAIMRQEQAPHLAKLQAGLTAEQGIKVAISDWLNRQIKTGAMNGPLTKATCNTTRGSTSSRVAFKCEMVTADVTYPFYGVVLPSTGTVTYCQQVVPPIYGMKDLTLSSACLAI